MTKSKIIKALDGIEIKFFSYISDYDLEDINNIKELFNERMTIYNELKEVKGFNKVFRKKEFKKYYKLNYKIHNELLIINSSYPRTRLNENIKSNRLFNLFLSNTILQVNNFLETTGNLDLTKEELSYYQNKFNQDNFDEKFIANEKEYQNSRKTVEELQSMLEKITFEL